MLNPPIPLSYVCLCQNEMYIPTQNRVHSAGSVCALLIIVVMHTTACQPRADNGVQFGYNRALATFVAHIMGYKQDVGFL